MFHQLKFQHAHTFFKKVTMFARNRKEQSQIWETVFFLAQCETRNYRKHCVYFQLHCFVIKQDVYSTFIILSDDCIRTAIHTSFVWKWQWWQFWQYFFLEVQTFFSFYRCKLVFQCCILCIERFFCFILNTTEKWNEMVPSCVRGTKHTITNSATIALGAFSIDFWSLLICTLFMIVGLGGCASGCCRRSDCDISVC